MNYALVLKSFDLLRDLLKDAPQREAVAVLERQVAELQSQLAEAVEAQLAQLKEGKALVEENESLREEVEKLREEAHDRKRYELLSPAPGALVYALKPSERGVDPPHWLCQKCRDKGVKAMLQDFRATHADPSRRKVALTCPECGRTLLVPRDDFDRHFR